MRGIGFERCLPASFIEFYESGWHKSKMLPYIQNWLAELTNLEIRVPTAMFDQMTRSFTTWLLEYSCIGNVFQRQPSYSKPTPVELRS